MKTLGSETLKANERIEEALKAAQAAVALMNTANKELKKERDEILTEAKALLSSDFGQAFSRLQQAVRRAESGVSF